MFERQVFDDDALGLDGDNRATAASVEHGGFAAIRVADERDLLADDEVPAVRAGDFDGVAVARLGERLGEVFVGGREVEVGDRGGADGGWCPCGSEGRQNKTSCGQGISDH